MRIDLQRCDFKNCKYQFDGNCMDKGRYEKCEYIELALNNLSSAQQWIPVTKRLPDSDDVVLTCYEDGSISTNWVGVHDNIREWVYDKEHVVAWMPLPMPWEGSEA